MVIISDEQTKERARKLLDSKIESITALAKAGQWVADLPEQLSQAKKEDKRSYIRATRDGWMPDHLKSLGPVNGILNQRRRGARSDVPSTPAIEEPCR